MAGDNYSYRKYRRELAKKKKKEAKMQRKLDKKNLKDKESSGQALVESAGVVLSVQPEPEPISDKEAQ